MYVSKERIRDGEVDLRDGMEREEDRGWELEEGWMGGWMKWGDCS